MLIPQGLIDPNKSKCLNGILSAFAGLAAFVSGAFARARRRVEGVVNAFNSAAIFAAA